MRRRVVITGMGVVSPLGDSVEGLYRGQIEGRSGVGRIQSFDASTFPTQIAAEVPNFNLSNYIENAERWQASGHNCKFGLAAAKMAMVDAGLYKNSQVDRTRLGVYMGCGEGRQDFNNLISLIARAYDAENHQFHDDQFCERGLHELLAEEEREQESHTPAAHLAYCFECEGPNYNCLTACAAGSQAVGEAAELIRRSEADLMLSGGAHSMIHPFGLTGFNLLTALSTSNEEPEKASRPFDAKRNGFVLGEGGAMLILEELEHAKKRGAQIYAEITGYGSTADAFRITDSHPDGRGAIAAIVQAMQDSGLNTSDIGYINAHGTSTQVNDRVETIAIKKVFGEESYRVPVSSSKSMLGHLIAAAGAIELIITVMAMKHGVLPPTINYENPDPELDLDYIPNEAREKKIQHALSNSFGFGGQNVSLVVSEYTA